MNITFRTYNLPDIIKIDDSTVLMFKVLLWQETFKTTPCLQDKYEIPITTNSTKTIIKIQIRLDKTVPNSDRLISPHEK